MAKSEKKIRLESNESVLGNYLQSKEDALKIVVTDGTTELARSFLYRMLYDNVFGENQSVFISLYELPSKAIFLESVAIELTSFSPKLLSGKRPYTVIFLRLRLRMLVQIYATYEKCRYTLHIFGYCFGILCARSCTTFKFCINA